MGPRPLTLRASRDHVASPPLDATSAAAVLPKALAANATPEPMTDVVAAPRHALRRRRAPRQLRHSPHRRVIRSCASIGEAFRALPLEAHFASVRSRVCVAVAHRHAPDHFDVVLAVAAMLYAVLRQCACKLHRVRSQQDGRGHREIESFESVALWSILSKNI